jgi:uncharacterized protein YprB with RNaseH-like and TPR domain
MQKREQSKLKRRLKRLGYRGRSPKRRRRAADRTASGLPPGEVIQTPHGKTFRIAKVFAMEHQHGSGLIGDLLSYESQLAAEIAGQSGLGDYPLDHLVFLDTETTGLAGGAGTLVFLVGVGAFVEDGFRLRQYFLRDPGEEAALLHALQDDLEKAAGFVTFNGRAFDVPLLEIRYVMGLRRQWSLSTVPHFDLLFPARRLWKRLLPDCTLGTLEREVCAIERTGEDVPGSEIPALYLDYLRTGDASQMRRVIYHNEVDVLSLVTLASQILRRHRPDDLAALSAAEALAVARWHQEAGRSDHADQAYSQARTKSARGIRLEVLRYQTIHLKREGRHDEALDGWRTWTKLTPDDPRPSIELAKYYEWKTQDLEEALKWAESALVCLTHWSAGWRRDQVWDEIQHRLERLARKLGK